MHLLIDVVLPGIVFLLMAIVGTGLTLEDLRRVLVIPRSVLGGLVGQLLLLPALAVLFIRLTGPAEIIAAGLLLLVASPSGALSNTYVYLAGANLALSVTLTALSSIVAFISLPLVMGFGFEFGLGRDLPMTVPVGRIVAQLTLLLLLPIALGMALKRLAPDLVERSRLLMQRISWSTIVGVVALVFHQEPGLVGADLGSSAVYAMGFTVIAMLLGLAVSRLSGRTTGSEHLCVALEFAVRNLPVATLIGATVLGRTDYAIFAVIVFLTQTPILAGLVWWYAHNRQTQ